MVKIIRAKVPVMSVNVISRTPLSQEKSPWRRKNILVYEVLINFNNKKQTEEMALGKVLPYQAQAPEFRSLTNMQELVWWSVFTTQAGVGERISQTLQTVTRSVSEGQVQ